jgi:(2R)-3-sulfolactate dehydrogenase (NADP+)
MATIHRGELAQLCREALLRVGASQRAAQALATATVETELIGNRAMGVTHLFDSLEGYREGRIAKDALGCFPRPRGDFSGRDCA